MKKIEEMTEAQQRAMIAHRERWLAAGRSTEPANRKAAEAAIVRMYKLLRHKAPRFWWSDGPATGSIIRASLINKPANLGDNLRYNLRDNLGANLGDNLRYNLRDNLGANLGANLRYNLWDNLGANLRYNLWDNLRYNLWANLMANLGDNLGANLMANLWDNLGDNISWSFWGQHEAAWSAYYDFPDKELRKIYSDSDREKLNLWLTLADNTGWWEPYQNVVFMCERPSVQLVNERGQLHCESGPALLCRDGFAVWALNGVRCKEHHVMTDAEKIEPQDVMKEENVEIRRELIRKVGIERMLAKLPHKILDTRGDYQVLSVDFPGLVQDARYLKMRNPSIDVWHLEGVERECNTVQKALNWRAGELALTADWNPAQLT